MPILRVRPVSLPNGSFAAAWFDDDRYLWDDERLSRAHPLLDAWNPPKLSSKAPNSEITEVMFNPNAIAVSEKIRNDLRELPGIEFLPITLNSFEEFYILHCTCACDMPVGASFRRVSPDGNIVQIFDLPADFRAPSTFFRIKQPADSPAGRTRSCFPDVFVNEEGASALRAICGNFLEVGELSDF